MATKQLWNTSIPHDEPVLIRPGVTHREADFHGSMKQIALEPEHPERAAKGDVGFASMKPSDYSFESEAPFPFANLKKQR